ncbi:MAG: glycoside hydrolase family 3 C-terminal domain-containing protein [Bacteroidales bacterium]|nr:glycoside hydrolase family 3 C-terminal domain-containing protein [Bacteroidales bacterium]
MKKSHIFLVILFIFDISVFANDNWADQTVKQLLKQLSVKQKISLLMNNSPAIDSTKIKAFNWWNEGLHGVANIQKVTVFPQAIGMAATWNPILIHQVADAISTEARILYHENKIGGLSFWSPNINIFRDPRWGRGQETYGEDPFLTSSFALQFITGLQGNNNRYFKLIATPKHFAVHSGPEYIRHHFNVNPSMSDLWDTYLPAFRTAIVDAKAYSIMGAYNSVFGVPACGSKLLLDDILRKQWGFNGYIVSDCEAITDIWQHHKYKQDAESASAFAVKVGCDLECGNQYYSLADAMRDGLLTEDQLDSTVFRVLKARVLLGEFEKDPSKNPYTHLNPKLLDCKNHRILAKQTALEGIVLLKNNGILPLSKRYKSIAVLGPNADAERVLYGNYNGFPSKSTTFLEGMQNKFGTKKINYIAGVPLVESLFETVSTKYLTGKNHENGGLTGEYFDNDSLGGLPKVVKIDPKINYIFEAEPLKGLPYDNFSIRWSGYITPESSGWYVFELSADDGVRFWINNKLAINNWRIGGESPKNFEYYLEKGKPYPIKIEYYDWKYRGAISFKWGKQFIHTNEFKTIPKMVCTNDNEGKYSFDSNFSPEESGLYNFKVTGKGKYSFRIGENEVLSELLTDRYTRKTASQWLEKGKKYPIFLKHESDSLTLEFGQINMDTLTLNKIANQAAKSDVIFFAGGISPLLESEEGQTTQTDGFIDGDRMNINLPHVQTYLLKKLKETGKPIILVLMNGSCIALDKQQQNLNAILTAWYPGEEGGNAIADIVSGCYNPSGRLPITFYNEMNDLSTFTDYSMKERTYRYMTKKPLYSFGFGLSYTKFEYKNLILPNNYKFKSDCDSITVSCEIKNIGNYDGSEVVQLYVNDSIGQSKGIIKSLKGFNKVFIKKNQSCKVNISVHRKDLIQYIPLLQTTDFSSGTYLFQIGSSSSNIKLSKNILLTSN